MTDKSLTADRILDAAEDCLRRFGPQKATVVDVARALSVSHGAIYRHYASKEALREAVVHRWLEREGARLRAIAQGDGPAPARLTRWLEHKIATAREKVQNEAELQATYCELMQDVNVRQLIGQYLATLCDQLASIVADGVRQGHFDTDDPVRAARAVFSATAAFHHPLLVRTWCDTGAACPHPNPLQAEFPEVLQLLLAGLGCKRS